MNVKLIEMESAYQEREKVTDGKISELQKRIHLLTQEIQDKEQEIIKLHEELGIMNE